jgi:hypothetical protein
MKPMLPKQINRRSLVKCLAFGAALPLVLAGDAEPEVSVVEFDDAGAKTGLVRVKKVMHTEAEWRKLLTLQQFYVTRKMPVFFAASAAELRYSARRRNSTARPDSPVFRLPSRRKTSTLLWIWRKSPSGWTSCACVATRTLATSTTTVPNRRTCAMR